MTNFLTGTSNAEYHADRTHLSSSALKLILENPRQFYREYILGEKVERKSAAMDEGTLVHALILEPHTVNRDFVVYPGSRRAGRAYDEFASKNPGKLVVTEAQMVRARELASACLANDAAKALLDGLPEHSMTGEIEGVPVKARADLVNQRRLQIVDVKTTSKPTGPFEETVQQYQYDLSAALYCEIAKQAFDIPFEFDFFWIVLSKADKGVSVVQATKEDLRIGRIKVEQAINLYKHCLKTGKWEFPNVSDFETRPLVATAKGERMSNVTFKTSKGTELPTMNLKGKPYLQVAHRFVALNDDVPRFNIRTNFLLINENETVCQAEVVLCSEIGEALKVATATKRETKKDFNDHTEKAETGAIGRALAMLGFGTQFAQADLDEGERIVDSPVQPAKKAKKSSEEF